MALDAGGARRRQREMTPADVQRQAAPEPTIKVRTRETHDGDACACIDQEITLRVGDTIELTHVCLDGRVDKVIAEVLSIDLPVEHGQVRQGSGAFFGPSSKSTAVSPALNFGNEKVGS